jgi:TonB family protein
VSQVSIQTPRPSAPRAEPVKIPTTRGDVAIATPRAAPSSATGSVTSLPRLLENDPPTYPPEAVARGWQGTVHLRLDISEGGRVVRAQIVRTSGYPLLDEAARSAVLTWRAQPGLHNGEPVAAAVRLPVRFDLRGQ